MNAVRAQQLTDWLLTRIIALPRPARIALAGLFAVSLTLLITPVVDGVYLSRFYDPSTLMLPTLVSTVLGVVLYLVGWRLMIGYAGEAPKPRMALLWYFAAGIVMVAVVIVLVVVGAISGTGT